jgi:hypothetical protein
MEMVFSYTVPVKSMYIDYMDDHIKYLHKYFWKIKVPLKIKLFILFLNKKVLLTKDNLIKRKWQGNEKCCFCDEKETIQHLFIQCPLAKITSIKWVFGLAPKSHLSPLGLSMGTNDRHWSRFVPFGGRSRFISENWSRFVA